MKKIIFTTSWDDGHEMDFKLAEILQKYNMKGTFYVAKKHPRQNLSKGEIAKLAKTAHEIGAHTLTHPELDKIELQKAIDEIIGSKNYLEDTIGKEVKMFCYPRGKYNKNVKEIVEKNFAGARITKKFCITKPQNKYEFGVSLHVYPFPFRKRNGKNLLWGRQMLSPILANSSSMLNLRLPSSSWISWNRLAKNLFDYAAHNGDIFHLYGHSWEIENYGMWEELENFLKYASQKGDFIPLTNNETLEHFYSENTRGQI
ncbi:MAG: polysaccharide deacetylase family protein [bacterium]